MKVRGEWRELIARRDEFQAIVRLLADFDERTGRFRRFADPETHYMRRSVATVDPEFLRVFLRDLGGFVYHVAVEVRATAGTVATSWVHEDGIRAERDTFAGERGHPVHGITCLSDLYNDESATMPGPPAEMHIPPCEPLLELMAERVSREELEQGA